MSVIFTHQVVDIIQETSNKQIKYCTNLLYLIFSLYWQGWTNRQNSPPVRECLSANTKWLETVNLLFNLSTTLLHGGHGEGKLPKFHYEFVFDVSEDVSSHLMLSTRRKFSILPPSLPLFHLLPCIGLTLPWQYTLMIFICGKATLFQALPCFNSSKKWKLKQTSENSNNKPGHQSILITLPTPTLPGYIQTDIVTVWFQSQDISLK